MSISCLPDVPASQVLLAFARKAQHDMLNASMSACTRGLLACLFLACVSELVGLPRSEQRLLNLSCHTSIESSHRSGVQRFAESDREEALQAERVTFPHELRRTSHMRWLGRWWTFSEELLLSSMKSIGPQPLSPERSRMGVHFFEGAISGFLFGFSLQPLKMGYPPKTTHPRAKPASSEVMHPLKSELHWPCGPVRPLDLAEATASWCMLVR